MKKNNSVLEIFWKGLAISIIVGIVIISITYLIADYPNKTPTTVNISFIKDVYSVIFAVFAPYIAIYLLTDWKEQLKYSKKVDFILNIRQEIRYLNNELFMLRNYYPLDIENPNDHLNVESANDKYNKSMSKFTNHLNKIEDHFEDLNFLLNTKDTDRNKIKKQLGGLRSFESLSRSAHRDIYNAIKNNKKINLTEAFVNKRSAYDSLYDSDPVEIDGKKISFNHSNTLNNNIKVLKNMCYEIYEEGYSKNRSLLNRLLDK